MMKNNNNNILSVILLLSSLFGVVSGHAKLQTPAAWNTQPSKTSPCGGGSAPSLAAISWNVNTQVSIAWTVIAQDGSGVVSVKWDLAGGSNFQGNATVLGSANAVGNYNFALLVPNVVATGPKGLITMQVFSSSGWFSCSSVQILGSNLPLPPPPAPICVVPIDLAFCLSRNHVNVQIPGGYTANAVDKSITDSYTTTLHNTNVFSNGNSSACATAYKNYLCQTGLPNCGQTYACKSLCQNALNLCGIQPAHITLYDCTQGPDDCNASSFLSFSLALLVFAFVTL